MTTEIIELLDKSSRVERAADIAHKSLADTPFSGNQKLFLRLFEFAYDDLNEDFDDKQPDPIEEKIVHLGAKLTILTEIVKRKQTPRKDRVYLLGLLLGIAIGYVIAFVTFYSAFSLADSLDRPGPPQVIRPAERERWSPPF